MRTMGANDLANNSLIRGAPIRIFEAVRQSQKAVSPIPIFLKPSFYHVELFKLILQSVFLDIYSVPEFHFWKLRWLLWERILLIWGVEGDIFNIFFQKYTSISPKCLIIQCIFVFTIVQFLQKSLHTAQAWFHTGVHYWSIRLPQTQHLSIILISNPNIVTENAFSLWFFFFFFFTVIQSL